MKHKFVPQHMQGVNNCKLQYKIPQSVTLLSACRIGLGARNPYEIFTE